MKCEITNADRIRAMSDEEWPCNSGQVAPKETGERVIKCAVSAGSNGSSNQ